MTIIEFFFILFLVGVIDYTIYEDFAPYLSEDSDSYKWKMSFCAIFFTHMLAAAIVGVSFYVAFL